LAFSGALPPGLRSRFELQGLHLYRARNNGARKYALVLPEEWHAGRDTAGRLRFGREEELNDHQQSRPQGLLT
jgi:hypothetical protein